jgi:protein O-GlcNAc transferase
MQLLRDVAGSVLWLRQLPADRAARLRDEATRRGVAGARLIVAQNDPIPRYLARFALADVFLDSAPFGSHTTVNDALFAGLPVVTVAGASFAGRASASQLAALGLPELIARDHAHYAEIARRLVTSPAERAAIVARLSNAAARAALFDMDAYARKFEAAVLREIARTSGKAT